MNTLFVTNVPDLSKWGILRRVSSDTPRPYLCRTLDITVQQSNPKYTKIIYEMARSIASARLDSYYLNLWDEATTKGKSSSKDVQTALTQALARGICSSGTHRPGQIPPCNDDHFKGHLIEVLLYCTRIHLAISGKTHPRIFEPPHPKSSPATPGIDLLEVGGINNKFYFQIWECKGTDGDAKAALRNAADQLCQFNGTAYQGFMEAYHCLQINDALTSGRSLSKFVSDMPRMFYTSPAHSAKRLGGVVGSNSDSTTSPAGSFAKKVKKAVSGSKMCCQVLVVKIVDFPQFRRDVFQQLWNIF